MSGPVLCFGETLVDLTCPEPVERFADACTFVPHPAGAAANVAVAVAQEGARVALTPGVGDDAWGRWLEPQLARAGVDLRLFTLTPGRETPVAFVTVDGDGSPAFVIYGRGIEDGIVAAEALLESLLAGCSALWIGSNTVVGDAERRVTHRAKELALALGLPVFVDANIRPARWRTPADAIQEVRSLAAGARILKLNDAEARLVGGDDDLERACATLLALGCPQVVVTCGANGALLRGEVDAEAPGVPARAVDTTGAGDAVSGVLLARLWAAEWELAVLEPALPDAMARAARCVEQLGALTYCLSEG